MSHEAELLTAQREVEALQRVLDGRRAEQAALRADYQQLRDRASALRDQRMPALQRQLIDARQELATRERDAAHAVALARRRVDGIEQALAHVHTDLQRLTGEQVRGD